jgi:Tfp pilus assembly protein PilX
VPDTAARFRKWLGDERGLALPMALGVMMVLSLLAAGIFSYVTMNQGAAKRATADQRAFGLAESGLSYAFSKLENAADPYNAASVPSTTVALSGGTVTYVGTLSGTTWTLTGTGTVPNPSGPNAANVVRTVSAQAQVTTTTGPDLRPWNYLFIDQPSGCIEMGNSVSLDLALYVRGDLCLTNNSQIDSPAVHVLGSLYVENEAQIGSVGDPVEEFAASGTCHYMGAAVACGPSSHVYASSVVAAPPTITKPTADLNHWYSNALLGPLSNCTTGSFPGGFDNDSTLNVSRGTVDLTPASAYNCIKDTNGDGTPEAQIRWEPGSPGTLTIKGTIYFDGDLTWTNLNLIQYDGRATIYASGTIRIANRADLCGVPTCDATWDPDVDLLVFVAGSLVAEGSSTFGGEVGNHVNFQGALYVVNDFEMDNNTSIWGPVITRNAEIANSSFIHAPPKPITELVLGMPSNTRTFVHVDPVQGSYSG